MRNSIVISVAVLAVLGLLVAGCGGGDDADAGQIDKATFIAEANKICEQSSGKLSADIASISQQESARPDYDFKESQIAVVKKGLIPRLEEEQRKIRALGIPDEAKNEIEAFLGQYQRSIDKTKEKLKIVALTPQLAPHEAIAVAGTKLGITECPISPVNANN